MIDPPASLARLLPVDASADGHRVDALLAHTTLVTAAFAVLVVALLGYLVARYRARPGRAARYERGDSRAAGGAVAALAAVALVALDVAPARASYGDLVARGPAPRGAGVVRVEVMAQQWVWNVRYPGPDGRFGTDDDALTADDLRVPVGAPVVVQLAARDVIHSFFVPALRVKQDAIPGRVTRAWFTATREGRYDLVCAELCGFAHYQMRGVVRAMPRAGFDAWLRGAEADARREQANAGAGAGGDPGRWGWAWAE